MSGSVERIVELYSGTVTENTTGSWFETLLKKNAAILVNVTAASGTSPTLVPIIEISPDASVAHYRATVVDQETQGSLTRLTAPTSEGKITTTGQYQLLIEGNISKYIRVRFELGGTSPSFTLTVTADLS
jgi:hypothetical protein